jgi:hypothetical protein
VYAAPLAVLALHNTVSLSVPPFALDVTEMTKDIILLIVRAIQLGFLAYIVYSLFTKNWWLLLQTISTYLFMLSSLFLFYSFLLLLGADYYHDYMIQYSFGSAAMLFVSCYLTVLSSRKRALKKAQA